MQSRLILLNELLQCAGSEAVHQPRSPPAGAKQPLMTGTKRTCRLCELTLKEST